MQWKTCVDRKKKRRKGRSNSKLTAKKLLRFLKRKMKNSTRRSIKMSKMMPVKALAKTPMVRKSRMKVKRLPMSKTQQAIRLAVQMQVSLELPLCSDKHLPPML